MYSIEKLGTDREMSDMLRYLRQKVYEKENDEKWLGQDRKHLKAGRLASANNRANKKLYAANVICQNVRIMCEPKIVIRGCNKC